MEVNGGDSGKGLPQGKHPLQHHVNWLMTNSISVCLLVSLSYFLASCEGAEFSLHIYLHLDLNWGLRLSVSIKLVHSRLRQAFPVHEVIVTERDKPQVKYVTPLCAMNIKFSATYKL